MGPEKSNSENVTVRIEPERTDAVNVYNIGRMEGYRDAMLDLLPIFGAIGVACFCFLIVRHWEN